MLTQTRDQEWTRLVSLSTEALRLTEEEASRFASSAVAKLVGLLPFIAGCDEAERTALAHLAILVIASRGTARRVFDHKASDNGDTYARLAPIADFRGGDRAVIGEGMRRLALCMVAGYEKDRKKDALSGDYNPLNAKSWNYEAVMADLAKPLTDASSSTTSKTTTTKKTTTDAIAGLDEAMSAETAVQGFWGV